MAAYTFTGAHHTHVLFTAPRVFPLPAPSRMTMGGVGPTVAALSAAPPAAATVAADIRGGEAWRRSIGGLDRSCGLSPPNVAPHDDLVVPLTAALLKVVQHVAQITRTERAVTSLRATPPRVVATISRCCAPRHA